jgi:sec-independent protein translocase protein TatB
MFNIGAGEFATLAVLALVLIGPDKLPDVARQAAKFLQKIRNLANNATVELRENLGPGFEDLQPSDLHPKKFIAKHLDTISGESEFREAKEIVENAKIDPDLL